MMVEQFNRRDFLLVMWPHKNVVTCLIGEVDLHYVFHYIRRDELTDIVLVPIV